MCELASDILRHNLGRYENPKISRNVSSFTCVSRCPRCRSKKINKFRCQAKLNLNCRWCQSHSGWPDEFSKWSPTHFLSKLIHNYILPWRRVAPPPLGYFCNYQKKSTIGTNWPNMFTLISPPPQKRKVTHNIWSSLLVSNNNLKKLAHIKYCCSQSLACRYLHTYAKRPFHRKMLQHLKGVGSHPDTVAVGNLLKQFKIRRYACKVIFTIVWLNRSNVSKFALKRRSLYSSLRHYGKNGIQTAIGSGDCVFESRQFVSHFIWINVLLSSDRRSTEDTKALPLVVSSLVTALVILSQICNGKASFWLLHTTGLMYKGPHRGLSHPYVFRAGRSKKERKVFDTC
jgi:hypothetical protein